jgi:hypothetical protein
MEVILRKRIAVTINKTEGWWTGKTFKNLLGYVRRLFYDNKIRCFFSLLENI